MRQFVSDDVDRDGEPVEDLAIAVAEHHLFAVPEGVVVLVAEVAGRLQRQPFVIDRVAAVLVEVEIVGVAEPIVGFVDPGVSRRTLAFAADEGAREHLAAVGVEDRALPLSARTSH